MNRYLTVGLSVLAGAAILEAALIPGLMIGGAAVLAPRYLPKALPGLGRRLRAQSGAGARGAFATPTPLADTTHSEDRRSNLKIGQAVAKTITFRMIVTALDFSTNYIVIGDLTAAAGLSAFGLIAGPLFYLAHETAWNYFGPGDRHINMMALLPGREPGSEHPRVTMSHALAKTITFRSIATVMDFYGELRGGRRTAHSRRTVGLRLRGGPLRVSRSRDGVGAPRQCSQRP